MFEAKVRPVGSSLGVLIPKSVIESDGIVRDQTVQVVLLKRDLSMLDKAFGLAKGAKPFVRDRSDRVL